MLITDTLPLAKAPGSRKQAPVTRGGFLQAKRQQGFPYKPKGPSWRKLQEACEAAHRLCRLS